jgi:hypothetical protein
MMWEPGIHGHGVIEAHPGRWSDRLLLRIRNLKVLKTKGCGSGLASSQSYFLWQKIVSVPASTGPGTGSFYFFLPFSYKN